MKTGPIPIFPAAVSLLLLAIAAVVGWNLEMKTRAATQQARSLATEAAKLGIHPGVVAERGPRLTRRKRENPADIPELAARYLSLTARYTEQREGQYPMDQAEMEKILELLRRIRGLDTEGIKILIASLPSGDTKEARAGRILTGRIMADLVIDDPRAAFQLLTESPDLLENKKEQGRLLAEALGNWAKENPDAAVRWMRENKASFAGEAGDELTRGLLAGVAASDPEFAFTLLEELGPGDPGMLTSLILRSTRGDGARLKAVAAYRVHMAGREPRTNMALIEMTSLVAEAGFDSASRWLEKASLTPDELARFARRLPGHTRPGDDGRWLEWISRNLPEKEAKSTIYQNFADWTKEDYLAAGTWLAGAPEGEMKNSAISAYASVVCIHDLETAEKWAITLPPGPARDSTLRSMLRKWPDRSPADKAAAQAFAEKHGIGK